MELPYSEACERNKGPILDVIRPVLADCRQLLEIGSGTAQHAVWLARHLPGLRWQPSDVAEHLPGIRARLAAEGPDNVLPPVVLDVAERPWPVAGVDAVFSANTLHIMGWDEVVEFFRGAGEIAAGGGVLIVYGPFRYGGAHTSTSNADFDLWLKRRDPGSGIRDFEAVDALARAEGFTLVADHAMPANNRTLVWHRMQERR